MEDVLLLVIPTMTYSEMVPVMVVSKIVEMAMSWMTKGELCKGNHNMYRQAYFGAVMSGSMQLPCTSSNKIWGGKRGIVIPVLGMTPWRCRKFCLDDVRGPVCTTHGRSPFPHSAPVSVHANSSVKGHCMWVHVLTELMPGPQLPAMQ